MKKLTFTWNGQEFPLEYDAIVQAAESLPSNQERINLVETAIQANLFRENCRVSKAIERKEAGDKRMITKLALDGTLEDCSNLQRSLICFLGILENRTEAISSGKITWKSEASNLIYLLMRLQRLGFIDSEKSIPAIVENHFQDSEALPFRNVKQQLQRIALFEKSKDSGSLDAIIKILREVNSE